ncbi:MAG: amidohydrolase family protein [Armatimonadota bacterium]
MALPIIDARVHIARGISPWSDAREVLRRAGVDTAMLTAHPESTQLDDDITLPLSAAGEDGPYAAYYVGGNPYEGYRRGRISVPRDLERWEAVHIRCFLSPSLDFGGATTAAQWEPDRLREIVEREDLGDLLAAAAQREMPVWLTEHFPVTLELIERYPDVRFVIPKMGAMNGGTAQVLNALAPYTHICFDTSCGELQESIVERIGYTRILFASGYPFNEPSEALDQLGALKLSDEEIGAIAGGNLLELIGA